MKKVASMIATDCNGRVDWVDDYNDYSIQGVYVVIK